MLVVDRIACVSDEDATGRTDVRQGPWVSEGVFWEMGLVEGMAQTAAALMGTRLSASGREFSRGMLAAVRDLEIHRDVLLGETIVFQVKRTRTIGPLSRVEAVAVCGEEVVARGELTFFVEAAP